MTWLRWDGRILSRIAGHGRRATAVIERGSTLSVDRGHLLILRRASANPSFLILDEATPAW